MALHATNRRSVLLATGSAAAAAIAGCASVASQLPGDDDGADGPDEEELRAAIEAYLEAGSEGDVDAFAEAVHPASPMHPDHWDGSDWELTLGNDQAPDEFDVESVTDDASVEDVLALEHADLWFDADALEEALDAEDIAIVEVASEELASSEQEIWALATDGGEWTVLFASTESDAPENPEEVFDPEIRDEDHDVVERVDWDWERTERGGDTHAEDVARARVILTDDPGIEADTVRIESTIAGSEVEFYTEQADNASTTWAGSWASVQLHPEGDQIVVTAIQDGDESVVHRVHYEP